LRRNLENFCSFLNAKAPEETELDHLRLSPVHLFEADQGVFQCEEFGALIGHHGGDLVKINCRRMLSILNSAAALLRGSSARRVNQDSPHDLGRDGKEVSPVSPACAPGVY
jgi:hypothetical protein